MRSLRRIICKLVGHKWGPWGYWGRGLKSSSCKRCDMLRLREETYSKPHPRVFCDAMRQTVAAPHWPKSCKDFVREEVVPELKQAIRSNSQGFASEIAQAIMDTPINPPRKPRSQR